MEHLEKETEQKYGALGYYCVIAPYLRRKLRALVKGAITTGIGLNDDSYPITPRDVFERYGIKLKV
jgi:hypothetical protein